MNNKNLIGIVLILVSIAGFVFFYKPISARVDVLKTDVEVKKADVVQLTNKLTLFDTQKSELDLATDIAISSVKNAIPSEMFQDQVIRNLIDISDTNKIALNSISFGKGAVNEDGVAVLRVNASFEGGFTDLVRFLEGLEVNKRKFTVNSISVQLASLTVGGVRRATFSLAMETYFLSN